jgi:DNA polymerase III gamma/tau subunit
VAIAQKFSPEDLMRAFEVLTKADYEIRGSAYPRYHLEMALLRGIHLRRLVPISDLIDAVSKGSPVASPPRSSAPGAPPIRRPMADAPAAPRPAPRPPSANAATIRAVEARKESAKPSAPTGPAGADAVPDVTAVAPEQLRDAFLEEVRKAKKFFYGTVVAQAQRVEMQTDRLVFTFAQKDRLLRSQFDQAPTRAWLEALATKLAGRRIGIASLEATGAPAKGDTPMQATASTSGGDRQSELRQQALADSGVQAMLDVFAADIKNVEEME